MRKKDTEEQNWGIGSPLILFLLFPFNNFAWNHCLFLLFSLYSQYLCSFTAFSPRPLPSEGWAVWFSWAPSPTTDLTAFKKMMWCYSVLSELISAFVHSKQDDKKAPQYWWEKLFKLMASTRVCFIFFVGVTTLMRFFVKSLHINVKQVHMRLWMGFCLKQGKGHLNFESCFYNIYLISFPQHSIWCSFSENTNNHTGSFPSLHKISFFYSQF